MLERLFLIIAAFFMFAIPASGGANVNITVEVVVPIGNYINASVNLSADQTTIINAPTANTTLEIGSSQNTSGSINLVLTSTPLDIPSLSVLSINKYLSIEASKSLTDNLTYVLIKLYYTHEEVNASGIEEGSLGFYWWNKTSSAWEKLNPAMGWVYSAGVDTIENYVWENVTHFSDYSVGGRRMPPALGINRDMPSTVKTGQKFDMELNLRNLAGFGLFNISVKEKIPEGYRLREAEKISPRPAQIRNENNQTVIYWSIDGLTSHSNLSIEYSLSAPNSPGNYTFRAEAFGFDALNNKYAAFNAAKQGVKQSPLWDTILEFFGIP
ncbi:Uncharacterised protein [uncultured archaeon]|nr:Uncharacterised protein [uncultured archaeon]